MEPTYRDGRPNLVYRWAYRRSLPERGDVVVLRKAGTLQRILKRIVGLPGEHAILKLAPSGPPVGVDRDAIYERGQVEWNPGDALLFYTDGAVEALLGKGKTGGLEEVVLKLGAGLSAGEIAQTLRSELEKTKEAQGLEDDVTLLTVSL
jgi:hypothetical protein